MNIFGLLFLFDRLSYFSFGFGLGLLTAVGAWRLSGWVQARRRVGRRVPWEEQAVEEFAELSISPTGDRPAGPFVRGVAKVSE